MGPNPQETADLVTFTEEILNVVTHCSGVYIVDLVQVNALCLGINVKPG